MWALSSRGRGGGSYGLGGRATKIILFCGSPNAAVRFKSRSSHIELLDPDATLLIFKQS